MYYALIYNINNKETITEQYSVERLLKNLENSTFSNKTKSKLLYKFLSVYQTNNVKDFRKIKSTLFNFHQHFNQSEKHDLVDILKYLFYSKRHETDVTKELFEIVKFSLKEGLLLEDGYLSNQSFDNCIQFAKANNEIDWIEKFIRDYKGLLNEKDKDSYLILGEFVLLFSKHQFKDALEKLALIRIRIPVRVAQLNCCKLQCLYELKYEDAFYHAVNASNQYLSNHEQDFTNINNFHMFKDFVLLIKKIYNIESNKISNKNEKVSHLNVLLGQIEKTNIKPYDTSWLKSKIKGLNNVYKNQTKLFN